MKKSNKLLLYGFLTIVLMIVAIHIALFAKYKSGDYTIYRPEDKLKDIMQSFPNVSHVTLRDVQGANVQFSDKAEVEKGKGDIIQYVQKGDSLVITGREESDFRPDGRRPVNITLPANVTLSVFNSFLYIEKGKQTSEINPSIYLKRSHVLFLDKDNPLQLGHVKLTASDSSIASFLGTIHVGRLEAQLYNSALEYNEGNVGEISIVSDSVSRISLRSKHLLKAKITTVPNNP